MSFFTVDKISLQFGGLKAVDSVSFSVEKGEIFTIIGPNGAGKTSIFNLISRLYDPTSGKLFFEGRDITEVPAHQIARLGIARTFQNIELFENATMLANLCGVEVVSPAAAAALELDVLVGLGWRLGPFFSPAVEVAYK